MAWVEYTIAGPSIQFLAAVEDRDEARRLAAAAGTPAPGKNDRLDRKDALYAVAVKRPGVLLWRHDEDPDHADGFEGHPWLAGAEKAPQFRAADVQRYNDIQQAARERRRHRR